MIDLGIGTIICLFRLYINSFDFVVNYDRMFIL